MNVLLVWELVPEDIEFYLLKDVTDLEVEKLKNANGNLINNVEDDSIMLDLDYISLSIGNPEYKSYSEDYMKEINFDSDKYGQWFKYKMELNEKGVYNIKDADIMINSGFLL